MNSFRFLILLATAVSGFVSLVDQVVWQRYLSILVGGESRSVSLVVAVFLCGLASGYQFFGSLTKKHTSFSRYQLMKFYGYIEFGIAIYTILFPHFFKLLKAMSFAGPNHLGFDLLISLITLFLPTFLMGASIPLLTMVVPENSKEVNDCHAKIYGWNTIGACLGVLVGGFYLVPQWGLPLTLYISGFLNLVIALIFMGNPLKGPLQKKDDVKNISHPLPQNFFYVFVFLTGLIIISLEMLFVRLLHLTLGAHIYNFTMVLFVVVLGLGAGSLSVNTQKLKLSVFLRRLALSCLLLFVVFLSVPYWPYWTSTLRVSLMTLPSNYPVFIFLSLLFCLIFLGPAMFFLGQLLPMAYAFIDKTKDNYGSVCGRLYFFNTLGTVLGSVLLGYLSFTIWNLDHIFLVSLLALFFLTLVISFYAKKRLLFAVIFFLGAYALLTPSWDRSSQQVGLFRTRTPTKAYFQKFFHVMTSEDLGHVLYFEDGPNTTVTVTENEVPKSREFQAFLKKKREEKRQEEGRQEESKREEEKREESQREEEKREEEKREESQRKEEKRKEEKRERRKKRRRKKRRRKKRRRKKRRRKKRRRKKRRRKKKRRKKRRRKKKRRKKKRKSKRSVFQRQLILASRKQRAHKKPLSFCQRKVRRQHVGRLFHSVLARRSPLSVLSIPKLRGGGGGSGHRGDRRTVRSTLRREKDHRVRDLPKGHRRGGFH